MTTRRSFLMQPQSVKTRRALFQLHRWVGVACGLYVLAISLSGSVLVYRPELDQLFATRTVMVVPGGHRLSDAELLACARADYPGIHFRAVEIHGSRAPERAAQVWFLFGGRRIGDGHIERLFDPYTGRDLGDAQGPEPQLLRWITGLHERLLGGALGEELNGAGAVLLTVLCLTGAVIWWPGHTRWRRSLVLRPNVGWRRFTWDLHSVLGGWLLLLVLMWAVTGVYLIFPVPFVSLTRTLWVHGVPTSASRAVGHALDWLVRLHFARSFGPWIKAALAILGLVPATLFVTGALMWWNRVLRRLPTCRRLSARDEVTHRRSRAGVATVRDRPREALVDAQGR